MGGITGILIGAMTGASAISDIDATIKKLERARDMIRADTERERAEAERETASTEASTEASHIHDE